MEKDQVAYTITDPDDLDIEASLEGRRVGYIWCLRDGCRLKIADLQVAQAYQRRGIGARLLRTVLQAADGAGIDEVWGVVTDDDLKRWPGLLRWYERNGFTITEPDADARDGPPAVKKIIRVR
jgi:ribosomal protein S18 acetylase RimI-like enzyme